MKVYLLFEQFNSKEKMSAGWELKPTSLAVWASAVTFRPSALYASLLH